MHSAPTQPQVCPRAHRSAVQIGRSGLGGDLTLWAVTSLYMPVQQNEMLDLTELLWHLPQGEGLPRCYSSAGGHTNCPKLD